MAQIPEVLYPPVQASWVGKVPVSVWQLSPACRATRQRRTCGSAQQIWSEVVFLFFLAPLEVLVGPVWSP